MHRQQRSNAAAAPSFQPSLWIEDSEIPHTSGAAASSTLGQHPSPRSSTEESSHQCLDQTSGTGLPINASNHCPSNEPEVRVSRARVCCRQKQQTARLLKWYAPSCFHTLLTHCPRRARDLADLTRNLLEVEESPALSTAKAMVGATTSSGAAAQAAPPPAPQLPSTSTQPRCSLVPPRAFALAQKLKDARRLLEAHGETTLSIAGLKSQMRGKLSATLQMPKKAEDSQYTTTHVEGMPGALMRSWLLSMGWVHAQESRPSALVFTTFNNKVLGQLYALNKTNQSIQASKLHTPKSSPKASTMIVAVAPATVTLYRRGDESEWASIVTNVATMNEACAPPMYSPHAL